LLAALLALSSLIIDLISGLLPGRFLERSPANPTWLREIFYETEWYKNQTWPEFAFLFEVSSRKEVKTASSLKIDLSIALANHLFYTLRDHNVSVLL
jgi:hypothetical protein